MLIIKIFYSFSPSDKCKEVFDNIKSFENVKLY